MNLVTFHRYLRTYYVMCCFIYLEGSGGLTFKADEVSDMKALSLPSAAPIREDVG